MKRFEDWPKRLSAFLDSRRNTPFKWGENDCALFACDSVNAIAGTDIAASFRGYADAESAAEIISRYGSLQELALFVAEEHGMLTIQPAFAQRGDPLLFDGPLGPTLGVISMDGSLIAAPSPDGLRFFPVSLATIAWRVG